MVHDQPSMDMTMFQTVDPSYAGDHQRQDSLVTSSALNLKQYSRPRTGTGSLIDHAILRATSFNGNTSNLASYELQVNVDTRRQKVVKKSYNMRHPSM